MELTKIKAEYITLAEAFQVFKRTNPYSLPMERRRIAATL